MLSFRTAENELIVLIVSMSLLNTPLEEGGGTRIFNRLCSNKRSNAKWKRASYTRGGKKCSERMENSHWLRAPRASLSSHVHLQL